MIRLAAALFGLVIGSFSNVIIHRVPIKESIVWPASHCPTRREEIKPRDNIPLLSYLMLRGRCRNCGTRIPVRYPVVEALSGLLFAAAAYEFGLSLDLLSALILIVVLVSLAGTDLEHRLLPNVIVGPAAVAGLAVLRWPDWLSLFLPTRSGGGFIRFLLLRWRVVFSRWPSYIPAAWAWET
ncbi:MAG TPA: prepilin peptidase [Rubrobacteraceae bacterium]|nr:prepilin peptidase [Rubrobacteraceae bacterium]